MLTAFGSIFRRYANRSVRAGKQHARRKSRKRRERFKTYCRRFPLFRCGSPANVWVSLLPTYTSFVLRSPSPSHRGTAGGDATPPNSAKSRCLKRSTKSSGSYTTRQVPNRRARHVIVVTDYFQGMEDRQRCSESGQARNRKRTILARREHAHFTAATNL